MPFVGGKRRKRERGTALRYRVETFGAPFGERPRKYVENGLRPCLDMGFIGIERKKKPCNFMFVDMEIWKLK